MSHGFLHHRLGLGLAALLCGLIAPPKANAERNPESLDTEIDVDESTHPESCVYSRTVWKNSLFLEFGEPSLVEEMQKFRSARGLSDFSAHATLTTVNTVKYPEKEDVIRAVTEVLRGLEVNRSFDMHIDGLMKFGDYTPHEMRMLQLEATGNFKGEEFENNKVQDLNGQSEGKRKLYVPPDTTDSKYKDKPLTHEEEKSFENLQILREKLCQKLAPSGTNCAKGQWKPHVSAGYVNAGAENCMNAAMALHWRNEMFSKGFLPATLNAAKISYWEMKDKLCKDWKEEAFVELDQGETTS